MDALTSPLVLAKIRLPAGRPRLISRTRLIERLTSGAAPRLTLVSAPAGYGKTTLLAEWAQELLKDGVGVAWNSLDAGDDDPLPFGACMPVTPHAWLTPPCTPSARHYSRPTPPTDWFERLRWLRESFPRGATARLEVDPVILAGWLPTRGGAPGFGRAAGVLAVAGWTRLGGWSWYSRGLGGGSGLGPRTRGWEAALSLHFSDRLRLAPD